MASRHSERTLPRVFVMMATYNGAEHLREQIESILSQEDVAVTLRICDDRSDDETASILNDYSHSDSRVVATVNQERLGVARNFMQMVYSVNPNDFDYYAFSDQDDVWLPGKLRTAVTSISAKETDAASKKIEGIGIPVLYCSELFDVDECLQNPVPELSRLSNDISHRASLLIRNRYSGCTMVFNRAHLMLTNYYPLDSFPRIHDVWMALLSYYCGNLVIDYDHPLILRRITGSNTEGATVRGKDLKSASISSLAKPSKSAARSTARLLLQGYSKFMSKSDRELIDSFCSYADKLLTRIKWAFSGNYRSLSPLDTLLARVKFLFARF